MDRRSFVLGSAASAVALTSRSANAQDTYPSRPITFINPFPPGGAVDVVGRPLAAVLEPMIQQPVVIDTKAGAAGQVGAQVAGPERGAAIEQVQPWGVDVASGVEAKPGKKDHGRMREFIQEVRRGERK